MGRPSVTAQRVEEILDAFEVCVARFGVEGATLEHVAQEAGLARALIRHHVGNKDELLTAMVQRFITRSDAITAAFFSGLPASDRADALVHGLFDARYNDPHLTKVVTALTLASSEHPELAGVMGRWTARFLGAIEAELTSAYPGATPTRVLAAAAGITGIYFNVDSLDALENSAALRASSLEAALMLLEALAAKP